MSTITRPLGLLAFLFLTGTAGSSFAIGFDTFGGGSRSTTPAKVVPAANCALTTYAAFANAKDSGADTYALSGTCNIDVAPAGKPTVVQKVKVQIFGEWMPKMKRASETVKIVHPDKNVSFSTWSTCTEDPFLEGSKATCTDQGFGANDFSLFLRKEDVPFARRRVTKVQLDMVTPRISARAQLYGTGNITGIEAPPTFELGREGTVRAPFKGGPGACPMEIDFGDGYVYQNVLTNTPPKAGAMHAYSKPGTYTVKAKALPGCSGEASTKVTVPGAIVESVRGQAKARTGLESSIVVSGRNGHCSFTIDYGDGSTEKKLLAGTTTVVPHRYLTPGRKQVTVKGIDGCTGTATGTVDVDVTAIKSLQRLGAVGPFQTFTATIDGGSCPLRVDWGDGSVQEMPNVTYTNGRVTLSHQYKTKGKFLVSARGVDGCVGVAGAWAELL